LVLRTKKPRRAGALSGASLLVPKVEGQSKLTNH
jgi:hypothetical protein